NRARRWGRGRGWQRSRRQPLLGLAGSRQPGGGTEYPAGSSRLSSCPRTRGNGWMVRLTGARAAGWLILWLLLPLEMAAQDRQVVGRVVEFGRMPRAAAVELTRTINRSLAHNAERGGERYDTQRQQVGAVLFEGPGST